MKRIVLAVLALALALPASATTTWSSIAPSTLPYASAGRSVKATCTTGTESAPTLATQGMDLDAVASYVVVVEADSGQTVASGTLQAYYYDAVDSVWVRVPDLDLTISSTAARGYTFLGSSPGLGMPVIAKRGRIAYLPSGVTISSGSLTVKLLATNSTGTAL